MSMCNGPDCEHCKTIKLGETHPHATGHVLNQKQEPQKPPSCKLVLKSGRWLEIELSASSVKYHRRNKLPITMVGED